MLGVEVCDPDGVEDAAGTTPGVGVLDARTVFEAQKQVRTAAGSLLLQSQTVLVSGYEIHVGRTESTHAPAVMLKTGASARGSAR